MVLKLSGYCLTFSHYSLLQLVNFITLVLYYCLYTFSLEQLLKIDQEMYINFSIRKHSIMIPTFYEKNIYYLLSVSMLFLFSITYR